MNSPATNPRMRATPTATNARPFLTRPLDDTPELYDTKFVRVNAGWRRPYMKGGGSSKGTASRSITVRLPARLGPARASGTGAGAAAEAAAPAAARGLRARLVDGEVAPAVGVVVQRADRVLRVL